MDPGEFIQKANRAYQLYDAAMAAFRAELTREDWIEAETERLKVISALEVFMDNLVQAHQTQAKMRKHG